MTPKLNLKTTDLICIDLQTGVFPKEGSLAHVGTDELLPNIKRVLAAARRQRSQLSILKKSTAKKW